MDLIYGMYTGKCENCGKIFDSREGEYLIEIPGQFLARSTCSIECAVNYKQRIIENKKNEYLKVKNGTRIIECEYTEEK